MTDARELLRGLVGRELRTISRRQRNVILRLEGDSVIVATDKAPKGEAVPIAWVQDGIDLLERDGEVRVDVPTLRQRSSFVGAVLSEYPGAHALTDPQRVRLTRP